MQGFKKKKNRSDTFSQIHNTADPTQDEDKANSIPG